METANGKSVGKTIVRAKINIESKQGTNENHKRKKSVKIALLMLFSLNLVPCLHLKTNPDCLFRYVDQLAKFKICIHP